MDSSLLCSWFTYINIFFKFFDILKYIWQIMYEKLLELSRNLKPGTCLNKCKSPICAVQLYKLCSFMWTTFKKFFKWFWNIIKRWSVIIVLMIVLIWKKYRSAEPFSNLWYDIFFFYKKQDIWKLLIKGQTITQLAKGLLIS